MYRKEKPITMKGSTSSLCNNLSVYIMPDKKQMSYAVVHKSVVNIACGTTDGSSITGRQLICKEPSAAQGLPFIIQSKWIILPSRTVLVLTTQKGIQIYEPDGSAMVYWHSLSDSPDRSNFAKGITGIGENLVCIGTERGDILVLDIPPKGSNVTVLETIKGHTVPITDLTSDRDLLVSVDDQGTIMVWKLSGQKFTQVTSIRSSGWPCNSVGLWENTIIAGYASGHLRVFNATNGVIGAEVTAHARSINAVHVAKDSGLALSVSDDTFLRVWQLKSADVPQIEHRHSECVTDLQLVGGHFVDGKGRALCLTGYDNNEIHFFVKS